jgi:uncharacterized protein YcfJ
MNKRTGKILLLFALPVFAAACAGQPLTTREKGTLAGGVLGAGTGAIVGSAVGAPGAGAAIGGALGAGTGLAVGNELQNNETANAQNSAALSQQQSEIEHQRSQIRELQRKSETE